MKNYRHGPNSPFILLLSLSAFAQVIIIPKEKNGLPEDANIIAIMIKRNTYHALKTPKRRWSGEDIHLQSQTRTRELSKQTTREENVWLKVTANVDPRVVELRGTVSSNSKNGHEVMNRGRKGSPNLVGFTELK